MRWRCRSHLSNLGPAVAKELTSRRMAQESGGKKRPKEGCRGRNRKERREAKEKQEIRKITISHEL